MRKLIAATAIAGALASGAVLASGPASADLLNERAQLLCSEMDYTTTYSGFTAYYRHTGVSLGDFAAALGYGVYHYCPQHASFAQTWLENL
jgi:hypothetical protein